MLTRADIMEIVPHRDPFLLIDEIDELEVGKRAKGKWHITGQEDFFRGHFPGYPVVPGVLIVEALSQVGAVAILTMPQFKGKLGFFAGIDGMRFKRMVKPGDTLVLETEITRVLAGIGQGVAVATVNGEKAAYGKMTFAVR